MWLPFLIAVAAADDATYRACCADLAPGACPSAIEVVGAGSSVSSRGDVALIEGVWSLTCGEGAAFYPWARRTTSGSAYDGAILTTLSDQAAACFDRACRLPEKMCVSNDEVGLRVVDCGTSAPATFTSWHARPADRAPAPVAAYVARERTVEQPTSFTWTQPTAFVATQPAAASSAAPVAPRPSAASVNLDSFSLPADPPSPCVPVASLRDASLTQTDLGDEARVAGDISAALGHYRAALAVDACNAYAWSAVGSMLLEQGSEEDAEHALRVSTRIMPGSARAWTELGRARELLGRYPDAISAFHEALVRQGDYAPAEEGLRRVSRGR
jgi:tetratricopeptide (TPR) repeat protein